ncbi:hypothetical protein VNO77_06175 [Canavalia gladiata]|uniref:Uncharacterized protein n=1 Tax=Canavalia gladiata TaxID=3824 RepID=A0AAN9M7V9_CANGL
MNQYNVKLLDVDLQVRGKNHRKHVVKAEIAVSVGTQALSTSEFNMNLASEGKGLIQSNGQTHQFLGKLHGSIEDLANIRFEETKNGHKQELFNIIRKAQGGSGSSGGGGKRGKSGTGGSADVNRRPHQNSAPSICCSHFWVSIFNLYSEPLVSTDTIEKQKRGYALCF